MAQYRAITDIFGPAPECRYFQAGDMLTDIVPTPSGWLPIPVGWKPPLGCEPMDAAAQTAFFNQGPSGMAGAEHGTPNTIVAGQRWSDKPVSAPAVYWKQAPGGGWTLGGKQWGNG